MIWHSAYLHPSVSFRNRQEKQNRAEIRVNNTIISISISKKYSMKYKRKQPGNQAEAILILNEQ